MNNIHEATKNEFAKTLEFRRYLHTHAELSFEEYETASYIEKQMLSLDGMDVSRPAPTAVLAVLRTGRPGRVLAFRADIDALPINEDNDLAYRSKNQGVMHACGHDGHAAALISAARILYSMRDQLSGEIRFIFQHAEETPPGGGIELVRTGVLDGVDECFGLHLTSTIETGKFGICPGVFTSATDRFDIEIIGKGGHSSMPQQCNDPIIAGCQTVLALQTVLTRSIKPDDAAVLSVCQIEAGSGYNIIPGSLTLTGSVRTFDETVRETIEKRIKEISTATCEAFGTHAKVTYSRGYDSVHNTMSLTQDIKNIVSKQFGEDAIVMLSPISPGDDYCYYSQKVPGFFVQLGTGCEQKGTRAPHHNAKYLMDEDALAFAVEFICALMVGRM